MPSLETLSARYDAWEQERAAAKAAKQADRDYRQTLQGCTDRLLEQQQDMLASAYKRQQVRPCGLECFRGGRLASHRSHLGSV